MLGKKPLPLELNSIKDILANGYLYVDKTEHIHQMIMARRCCFFSRPRRFGKSLLVSTIKEIFNGNRELFADTWIGRSEYVWNVHPVLHFDLSGIICTSPEILEKNLSKLVVDSARTYGIDVSDEQGSGAQLRSLIMQLSVINSVVVLIDEYDYPIIRNLDALAVAKANKDVLRDFYTVLKPLSGELRFLFLTGVSKFSKMSLFSGLNNLVDLSFDERYATLVGYTQDEIELYLGLYIDAVAHARALPHDAILAEMREWYNGYHFSDAPLGVYNPFSVFHYLDKKKLANYWFESATPTFLLEVIKSGGYTPQDINYVLATSTDLSSFNLDDIGLAALLYQTGYLTIKSYDSSGKYLLVYPNKEVEYSLAGPLLTVFTHVKQSVLNQSGQRLREAVLAANANSFCSELQQKRLSVEWVVDEAC